MWTPVTCSPDVADAWDLLAERMAEVEKAPMDLPEGVAGFEYFVLPDGVLKSSHSFGGYDAYDDETGELEVCLMVSETLPVEVRGLVVGHMVIHKTETDDLGPTLCSDIDRKIQSALEDLEPDLIRPYFKEALTMYSHGQDHIRPLRRHPLYSILNPRYDRAIRNAQSRGRLAKRADAARERLRQEGLIIPDGDLALSAKDHKGETIRISLHTERSEVHKCRCCSNPIPRYSPRFTTSTEVEIDGYDHHHYHPGCFTHVELGMFEDFKQISQADTYLKRPTK